MWQCIKCGASNDDQYTVCPQCGASRSAGRFGAAAQTPRNAAAYTASVRQNIQPSGQPAVRAEMPLPPQAPASQYVPDFAHVRAGRGLMLAGTILVLTLPLLVLLIAVFRYDVYAPAAMALFFREPEQITVFLRLPLYVLLTLLSALVAALPGLWTLAAGKALRRLARMEELL